MRVSVGCYAGEYAFCDGGRWTGDGGRLDGGRWTGDGRGLLGTDGSLQDDKRGKKTRSVFMVAVTDVHSLANLSLFFTYNENRWAYKELLCGAVRAVGHLPYELVCDRFPGHNTPEGTAMIARLESNGVKVTITTEASGKAAQERWWRTLQNFCFQFSANYYGEGVKSKGDNAHRTPEYIAAQTKIAKSEGWSYDALADEVGHRVAQWNETPLCKWSPKKKNLTKSPMQLFRESAKPSCIVLKPERFAELFGYETQHQLHHLGEVSPIIEGQEYTYKLDDWDLIRRYEGKRLTLCIDLENPEVCYLFEPAVDKDQYYKRYIGVASRELAVVRYGPEANWGDIALRKARIKGLMAARAADLLERKGVDSGAEIGVLMAQLQGKAGYNEAEEWLELDGGRETVEGGRQTMEGGRQTVEGVTAPRPPKGGVKSRLGDDQSIDEPISQSPKRKASLYDYL
jgi:hypothetical protein